MRKRQPKSWQGRGLELEAPAPKTTLISETWVIDAGLSRPGDGVLCFCPCEGEPGTESFEVITGMNLLSSKAPGKLVAIIHPDGDEAAEEWLELHRALVERAASEEEA